MMQFTKIDINNWTRKEYFDHYFDNTPCTYSMTVKLDISKLKKDGKKLYPTLLYGVTTILNRHEEFRTALDKNGQVGVFSEMLPCYTIFHKETETFSSIWTEFTADYTEFLQNYQKDIDAYGERKGMFAKPNPPENTFPVSMIPWTSFEGFNLNLKKDMTIYCRYLRLGSIMRMAENTIFPYRFKCIMQCVMDFISAGLSMNCKN